jgi:ABC-2 type transport system permease protein
MSRALHAEWAKLRALRSTTWALIALLALTLLFTLLLTAGTSTDGCAPGSQECEDAIALALGGVYLGQFAVVTLGVLAITSEFATGMIRTTFTALPRRAAVLAAKAAVVGGLTLAGGLVAAVLAFLLGSTLLEGNGFTPDHGYTPPSLLEATTLRAVLGSAVYLAGLAIFSLGFGAVLRHTAAAITTVLGLLWVPLIVISMLPMDLGLKIARWCPMFAGLAITSTVERVDTIPIAPGAGLALFCGYALAALAAGVWLVSHRDT